MEKIGTFKVEINHEGLINALLCKEEPSIIEDTSGSQVRGEAPDGDGSDMRWKTRKDNEQHRQEATSSRSQIMPDGDGIKRLGSTFIFVHP